MDIEEGEPEHDQPEGAEQPGTAGDPLDDETNKKQVYEDVFGEDEDNTSKHRKKHVLCYCSARPRCPKFI